MKGSFVATRVFIVPFISLLLFGIVTWNFPALAVAQSIVPDDSLLSGVAVGTPVDLTPPARIRTCRIAACGSYLRCLASKRKLG